MNFNTNKEKGIYVILIEEVYNKSTLNICYKYDEMYKVKKEKNTMNSKSYIGNFVEVKVDRPMGSKHPKHGFIYPINYGYVPNIISGDGEELDCYVLGVFEPVETFKGKCIAIIHRFNDNDDKLVVVPENKTYSNEAIRVLTEFQERFFESTIIN